MGNRKKTIVILSGGLDSTVLLWSLLASGDEIVALTFDYGQRHSREIDAARAICAESNTKQLVIDLSPLRKVMVGNSQTDQEIEVPHGHYADETMKKTIVPNRNMIMLAVAGAAAVSFNAQAIAYGAHAGDHPIYPDCRPIFTDAMEKAFLVASLEPIRLLRPFINMSKADIVALGSKIGAPMHLTYSCYEGNHSYHCGECGTCIERKEAFRNANVADRTKYRSQSR